MIAELSLGLRAMIVRQFDYFSLLHMIEWILSRKHHQATMIIETGTIRDTE